MRRVHGERGAELGGLRVRAHQALEVNRPVGTGASAAASHIGLRLAQEWRIESCDRVTIAERATDGHRPGHRGRQQRARVSPRKRHYDQRPARRQDGEPWTRPEVEPHPGRGPDQEPERQPRRHISHASADATCGHSGGAPQSAESGGQTAECERVDQGEALPPWKRASARYRRRDDRPHGSLVG